MRTCAQCSPGTAHRRGRAVALLTLALAAAASAVAGGARSVNGLGQPMAWPRSGAIAYNCDQGPLGALTNEDARAVVRSAFDVWQSVMLTTLLFVDDPGFRSAAVRADTPQLRSSRGRRATHPAQRC